MARRPGPSFFALRVTGYDQRTQLRPRHDLIHLLENRVRTSAMQLKACRGQGVLRWFSPPYRPLAIMQFYASARRNWSCSRWHQTKPKAAFRNNADRGVRETQPFLIFQDYSLAATNLRSHKHGEQRPQPDHLPQVRAVFARHRRWFVELAQRITRLIDTAISKILKPIIESNKNAQSENLTTDMMKAALIADQEALCYE
jgi:hypothetical protein